MNPLLATREVGYREPTAIACEYPNSATPLSARKLSKIAHIKRS